MEQLLKDPWATAMALGTSIVVLLMAWELLKVIGALFSELTKKKPKK